MPSFGLGIRPLGPRICSHTTVHQHSTTAARIGKTTHLSDSTDEGHEVRRRDTLRECDVTRLDQRHQVLSTHNGGTCSLATDTQLKCKDRSAHRSAHPSDTHTRANKHIDTRRPRTSSFGLLRFFSPRKHCNDGFLSSTVRQLVGRARMRGGEARHCKHNTGVFTPVRRP